MLNGKLSNLQLKLLDELETLRQSDNVTCGNQYTLIRTQMPLFELKMHEKSLIILFYVTSCLNHTLITIIVIPMLVP